MKKGWTEGKKGGTLWETWRHSSLVLATSHASRIYKAKLLVAEATYLNFDFKLKMTWLGPTRVLYIILDKTDIKC